MLYKIYLIKFETFEFQQELNKVYRFQHRHSKWLKLLSPVPTPWEREWCVMIKENKSKSTSDDGTYRRFPRELVLKLIEPAEATGEILESRMTVQRTKARVICQTHLNSHKHAVVLDRLNQLPTEIGYILMVEMTPNPVVVKGRLMRDSQDKLWVQAGRRLFAPIVRKTGNTQWGMIEEGLRLVQLPSKEEYWIEPDS